MIESTQEQAKYFRRIAIILRGARTSIDTVSAQQNDDYKAFWERIQYELNLLETECLEQERWCKGL